MPKVNTMRPFLEGTYDRLRRYEGSLVKLGAVRRLRHSKEYVSMLARSGAVERVAWGWYYVPARREATSMLDFLARDKNFNVVTGQTAASFWNGDFIHREVVSVAVDSPSYKRALEAFAEKRGWNVVVEYDPDARKIRQKRIRGLRVEDRETAIVDCMRRWAFVDAVATLSKEAVEPLRKRAYWVRLSGTDVRVGQAVDYAAYRLFGMGHDVTIGNEAVREELDEAVEKVMALA